MDLKILFKALKTGMVKADRKGIESVGSQAGRRPHRAGIGTGRRITQGAIQPHQGILTKGKGSVQLTSSLRKLVL